jgi:hypothetical protein
MSRGHIFFSVIPGRRETSNPESRAIECRLWIPGPLALLASRNDGKVL